ncbi:MAG: hypothetical protein ACYC6Y_20640 [Thermoguttaceae bacterium]
MFTLFLFCAVIGGTFLACQIVMTLLGAGGDGHVDVSGHMGDVGDVHLDVGGDISHVDVGTHGGGSHQGAGHDDSTSAFRIISFRTVIAGLAFFGLGGLAADAVEATPIAVWTVALGCGAAAMYAVYRVFRTLYGLSEEGTARIANAVGRRGTVYLRIPGQESGTGKVQVNLQGRTVEYLAMTAGDELPTGAKIIVVDVLGSSTVQVEPALEPERSEHV